jgi:transcriptional regulator
VIESELSSKGLTQQEIAVQLKYTPQTISNDLKYLQKKAIESLGRQAEQVAADYQQVLSNLYSIRKEAWALYEKTGDERVKVMLYNTITNVNMAIMHVRSTGDIIEQEVLAESKNWTKDFALYIMFCRAMAEGDKIRAESCMKLLEREFRNLFSNRRR